MKILLGDCMGHLMLMADNSIDSVVTDPPAGISFMGKDWDGDKGGSEAWITWLQSVMAECLRVLKPGGHAFVWAFPRTSHWTGMALERAGFEVRDCITHHHGSGFPKSLDVSKAIDKASGITEWKETTPNPAWRAGNTDAAKQWQGWGTALKPATEFYWLCRKPLSEKTVAANVLKWGTGALNIDGSRIALIGNENLGAVQNGRIYGGDGSSGKFGKAQQSEVTPTYKSNGRFPANLVLSHSEDCELECAEGCPVAELDRQSGSQKDRPAKKALSGEGSGDGHQGMFAGSVAKTGYQTEGGASRFFYVAKASRRERNAGLDSTPAEGRSSALGAPRENHHPTVKPLKLMQYLIRLITPPGGTVLDPFMGSGTTGVAALSEGFGFIGIEKESEYHAIALARMEAIDA